MAAILAAGITAYMIVIPLMQAQTESAVMRASRLDMPADLALLVSHIVTYEERHDFDPTKNVTEYICPASHGSRQMPWDALSGFRSVEFANVEQVLSSRGMHDALFASPDSHWLLESTEMVEGRVVATPGEVMLPVWFAEDLGVKVGDSLEFVFYSPPLHEMKPAAFRISGLFNTQFLLADVPIFFEPHDHSHSVSEIIELWQRGTHARLLALFDLGGNSVDPIEAAYILTEAFSTPEDPTANWRFRLSVVTGFAPDTPEKMARALAQDVHMPAANALFLSFVFVGIGLFTVMLLSFFDRRKDIAVMKTVGVSNQDVACVIIAEIIVVAVAGIGLGAALSFLAMRSLGASTAAGVIALKWSNIVNAAVIGLLVMFLAALFPVSLARSATVNQLLYDQKIYLFRRRVMTTVRGIPGGNSYR